MLDDKVFRPNFGTSCGIDDFETPPTDAYDREPRGLMYDDDAEPEAPRGKQERFKHASRLWSVNDDDDNLEAPCVIEDLLEKGEVSLLFGSSMVGKSFIGIDICKHVALGRKWFDRDVMQGGAMYYQFEGRGSFKKRLQAATIGLSDEERSSFHRLVKVARAPPTVKPSDTRAAREQIALDMEEYIEEAGEPPQIFFIDTLQKMLAGVSVNDDATITGLIGLAQWVANQYGCHVCVIHHPGLAEKERPAGSNQITSGFTTMLRIDPGSALKNAPISLDDVRSVVIVKNKDYGGEGDTLAAYSLKQIELGQKANGKPITSCVVLHHDPATSRQLNSSDESRKRAKLTPLTLKLKQFIETAYLDGHALKVPPERLKRGGDKLVRVLPRLELFDICCDRGLASTTAEDRKARRNAHRRAFDRGLRDLEKNGIVDHNDDFVWLLSQHELQEPAERSSGQERSNLKMTADDRDDHCAGGQAVKAVTTPLGGDRV